MHGTERNGPSRRVIVQAACLAAFLIADGTAAYLLGAPVWISVLYVALGPVLAYVRIRVARADAPAAAAAPAPPGTQALGYVFIGEGVDGELASQRSRIGACCTEHGLTLATVVHDRALPGNSHARPSLAWALQEISTGAADVLVVSRLRDLSSNVANLPPLLSWFDTRDRRLIAVDLGLDTATEAGRLAATAVAGVGGWEHERLSERTRRGLEAARSRGGGQGRTAVADVPELADRIAAMRERGMTLQAIADTLNREGVPTLRGGAMWRPSSVQRATGYRRPSNQTRGIELPKSRPSRS